MTLAAIALFFFMAPISAAQASQAPQTNPTSTSSRAFATRSRSGNPIRDETPRAHSGKGVYRLKKGAFDEGA